MRILIFAIAVILSQFSNGQHELINRVCYNSDGDDYCVRIINDRIYFISDKPDSSRNRIKDKSTDYWFTDIYEQVECGRQVAKLVKNSLGESVSINSSWYDGPISYSKKDSVLFFSNTSEGSVHGKMGIYWSKELADGSFTDPVAFPLNSSQYSCMHPYFDELSSMLYFSSDLANDSSGFDLYRIKFNGKDFLDLDTLSNLNSVDNELFPFVREQVVYFSSDRRSSFGGLNIYSSANLKVEPLDYPFNSEFDDFAISFTSSNRGYFSSNRKEGIDDDIYEFYIPRTNTTPLPNTEINSIIAKLEGLLKNEDPNSTESLILQTAIDKLREQEKDLAELKQQIFEQQERIMNYTDTSSYLTFEERVDVYKNVIEEQAVINQQNVQEKLPAEIVSGIDKINKIRQQAEEIVSNESSFVDEKIIPFLAEKPKNLGHINDIIEHYDFDDHSVGQIMATSYPLEFYFEFDKFNLTEEQLIEVRKLITAVKGYNGMMKITGHTDDIGTKAYNLGLSKRRANHIAKLLINEGFDKEKLEILGKGESDPKYSNMTKDGRKKNRRVVITL